MWVVGGWWWHSRTESHQVLLTLDLDLDCDNSSAHVHVKKLKLLLKNNILIGGKKSDPILIICDGE